MLPRYKSNINDITIFPCGHIEFVTLKTQVTFGTKVTVTQVAIKF